MHSALIVLICGGSFEGKSLVALRLASRFNFSGVITTDAVRNFLRIKEGSKDYLGTSTYLLSPELLEQQMEDVSSVIRQMIDIYLKRGEHIIIEGMHLSSDFLEWASDKPFCKICLHNTLPLGERIRLKTLTRSRLSGAAPISAKNRAYPVSDLNVQNTSYMKYAHRIEEIHSAVVARCRKHGFHIIEFTDLAQCTDEAARILGNWIQNEAEI